MKSLLKRIVPHRWHPPAVAARARARWARSDLVRSGPFAGMRFTWEDWNPSFSAPFPKMMGTYELELHPIIERIIARPPRRIVEIGAADGYYAVGFARRLPRTEIVAFEELATGRELLTRFATLNGVRERIQMHGRCEPDTLRATLQPGDILMLDVEGYERVLIDPAAVPALVHTPILVECHDALVPGVSALLESRFQATHAITRIPNRVRMIAEIPDASWLLRFYCRYNLFGWVNERVGGPMQWLFLEPKSALSSPTA